MNSSRRPRYSDYFAFEDQGRKVSAMEVQAASHSYRKKRRRHFLIINASWRYISAKQLFLQKSSGNTQTPISGGATVLRPKH